MSRSHGRIMAAIWNDADFTAMRGSAQRVFMFLLSQADLSHAGLLPMRVNRWAKKAEDTTAKSIRSELDYLAARDFIVVDEDTEEVLIRTMVRNDGVYKQPRVMDRLREDARQIESPLLRDAFAAELDRLPLDELSTAPSGRDGDGPSTREQVERVVEALRHDFADSFGRVAERVTETLTDTPRVRAGVSTYPHPPAPSPRPQPPTTVPPTAGDAEAPRALAAVPSGELDRPTAQMLVAEWIDHCDKRPPGNVVGQVAKHLGALIDEGFTPDELRRALAEWNRKGLHPSTLPSVLHEVNNRAPAKPRTQQGTDDLFSAAMERAAARDGSSR